MHRGSGDAREAPSGLGGTMGEKTKTSLVPFFVCFLRGLRETTL